VKPFWGIQHFFSGMGPKHILVLVKQQETSLAGKLLVQSKFYMPRIN
jgi:hypothetical protein